MTFVVSRNPLLVGTEAKEAVQVDPLPGLPFSEQIYLFAANALSGQDRRRKRKISIFFLSFFIFSLKKFGSVVLFTASLR